MYNQTSRLCQNRKRLTHNDSEGDLANTASIGLRALEKPRAVVTSEGAPLSNEMTGELDTIVVPAHKDGFEEVFLGTDSWYAVGIAGDMLPKIRYVAGYQNAPISAITHFAPVGKIEPYGENGKYRLFSRQRLKI